MEQQDSVRGELQTLIMLEQQQTESLNTISRQGAAVQAGGNMGGSGGYGAPRFGGLNNIPLVGDYTSQFRDFQTQYAQTSNFARTPVRVVSDIGSRINQRTDSDPTGFFFQNQSKVNAMQREAAGVNLGERFTTGTLSAASSLTSLAGNAVGGGIAGALGGGMIAGGLVGAGVGAAASFVVATGADQMRQNYAYEKFLRNNSYKFIDLFETNNTRQPAGFNRQERWKMADYLRSFGTENKISDKDTMSLLQGFTNGNLLRGVSDAESFKKQMKSLTESTKKIALAWNTSFEDAVKAMEDMKKAGLDTRNYSRYAANAKIVGSITGQTGAEVGEFNMNLSQNIIARSGNDMLDANGIYNATSGIQAYVGKMYNDADKRLQEDLFDAEARQRYDLITNKGGIEGATEDFMYRAVDAISNNDNGAFSTITAGLYSWDGQKWVFDERKFKQFKNSGADLATLAGMGTETLNNAGYAAIADWQERSSMYTTSAFMNDPVKLASFLKTIVNAGGQMTELRGADTSTILSTVLGIKDNDKWLGTMVDAINGDGGDLYNKVRLATIGQEIQDAYNSQRTGMGYQVTSWWNGVKDSIGNWFSPLANTFNKVGEYMSDWWYGQKYEDVRSLWNEVDWDNTGMDKLQRYLASSANEDDMKALGIGNQFTTINRDYYKSFDTLVSKIEGAFGKLGDAATDTASKMRDAADEYGVSESVMTQLFSTFGIKNAQEGEELLKEYSNYQGTYLRGHDSASQSDVYKSFLNAHGKEGAYREEAANMTSLEQIKTYIGHDISVSDNPFGKHGIPGLAGQPDTWDLSSLAVAPSEAEKKQAIDKYFRTWINYQMSPILAGFVTAADEDNIIKSLTQYDTSSFLNQIVGGTDGFLDDNEAAAIKAINQSQQQDEDNLLEAMDRNALKKASIYQALQEVNVENDGNITAKAFDAKLNKYGIDTDEALRKIGYTRKDNAIGQMVYGIKGGQRFSQVTTDALLDSAKDLLNESDIENITITQKQYDKLNHLHQRTNDNGETYYDYDENEEIGYWNSVGGVGVWVKDEKGNRTKKYLNKNINYREALSQGIGRYIITGDTNDVPLAEYQKELRTNIQKIEADALKNGSAARTALTVRGEFQKVMGSHADAAEKALFDGITEDEFVKQYGGSTEISQGNARNAYGIYKQYTEGLQDGDNIWENYSKNVNTEELLGKVQTDARAQASMDSTILRALGADASTAAKAQKRMTTAAKNGSFKDIQEATEANNEAKARIIFGDELYEEFMDSSNRDFGNYLADGSEKLQDSEKYKKVVSRTASALVSIGMSPEEAQSTAKDWIFAQANADKKSNKDVLLGEQGLMRQLTTVAANSSDIKEEDSLAQLRDELSENTLALNANTTAMKGKPTDYTPPNKTKEKTEKEENKDAGSSYTGG